MLEPLTAISLAGNVVQFVQFGYNLVAKTHEIYTSRSGELKEDLETETVTTRILQSIEDLESSRKHAGSCSDTFIERRLVEIAEACTEIAKDILRRLERLRFKESRTIWASISRALKAV